MVLGGHGDQMVPVVSATTVGGVPLEQLTTKGRSRRWSSARGRAAASSSGCSGRRPGTRRARRRRRWSTPICLDQKRVLPCTALLEGEYGVDGLYMGVPVRLGAGGVEEIVKLKLTAAEKKMVRESAAAVREVVGVLTTTRSRSVKRRRPLGLRALHRR